MAEVKGYSGNVALTAVLASDSAWNTHQWSLDISSETHDVTNFDSTGWKKFLGGLKSWTGSVEMYISSDTSLRIQPSDVGSEVTGRFYLDTTSVLAGKAIISGWNPSVAVDGVETQTLNIQGSSDLTYGS